MIVDIKNVNIRMAVEPDGDGNPMIHFTMEIPERLIGELVPPPFQARARQMIWSEKVSKVMIAS